jgi:hypothetical protein
MTPKAQVKMNTAAEMGVTAVRSSVLQRKCGCGTHTIAGGECSECRKKPRVLQRQAITPAPASIPPIVPEVLRQPGQPLDAATRAFMEPRFGQDFSHVRVHTDAKAAESATAVSARAYSVGSNVVFAAGRYAPSTYEGRRLLAHELTHTIQQKDASLHPSLEIGRVDDPGELEADRVADAVMGGVAPSSVSAAGRPGVLRRAPDEPKPLQTDIAHLPVPGVENEKVHVIRKLMPCECRKVPDVRDGIFYNPDMDALAIGYRHCRGGATTDVFAQVESNLSSFLAGGPPPSGTARIGFEINVVGKKVGGRAVLEVLGSNVSGGQGVGGRAQVVFQGDKWRVFVTSDFLHKLGANSGDDLELNLGARLGPITAEIQVQNILSSTPTGTGAGCVDIFGGSARFCFTLSGGGGSGVTGGFKFDVPLGGPEVRREDCFQCLCPPPVKRYTCYHDIPPTERPVEREIEVEVPNEFRYYFKLNKTAPAEDSKLRERGNKSLGDVATEVAAGGSVVMITGYASPEATESHNKTLSADRAQTLTELVRNKVPPDTALPTPNPGGELLGSRPAPSKSSKLGDAIRAGGFRSAEDISIFLLGEEIPNKELSDQFVSLFKALPEAADRLALFGLTPEDPIASKVLATIEAFMRSPRAGTRPWENVFRMLRVGVIRTTRPEKRKITETERTSGSIDELGSAACELKAKEAEQSGLLPPVPPELRKPRRSREDRDVECTIEVRPQDRATGCDYTVTSDMRLKPKAPARTPKPF